MEKYKKLNIIAASLFLITIIISVFDYKNFLGYDMFYATFFSLPIIWLSSLVLSIISVKIKRNRVGFILLTLLVLAFIPVHWMQIYVITCLITGYH